MEEPQRRALINALILGTDRTTAAHWAGLTENELTSALAQYPDLERDVSQAEATATLNHVTTLKDAAKDPKNWRASVFWLRSRKPDRYARNAGAITKTQLTEFIEQLFSELAAHFEPEELRDVHAKLLTILEHLDQE